MRRGRPTKAEGDSRAPKQSPSPLRVAANDPWAALDSSTMNVPETGLFDDASARFPALDDFSLLHDSGTKFAFDPNRDSKKRSSRDISQRVTDALADDAFAQPRAPSKPIQSQPSPGPKQADSKPKPSLIDAPKTKPIHIINTQETTSQRPSMVSTGTMTSPSPPSPSLHNNGAANRPVFRFPSSSADHRSSSLPRASDSTDTNAGSFRADSAGNKRPAFLEHRSKSQILTADSPHFSQPSLEINHRSSYLGGLDSSIQRSKSANSRARPASVQNPSKPSLLRRMSREKAKPEESKHEMSNAPLISAPTGDIDDGEEAVRIDSNVAFLKAMEEEDASKRKEKRLSSGPRHIKRASMPSVSLSGTKNLLAGRFGDAFKRFETNGVGSERRDSSQSPVRGSSGLTPIAGSEATDGRSDDGHDMEESEEIPPEMRRELERRRLSQEEKRVADAAAAYRQRLAQGGDSGRGRSTSNKAISIQSKVKTLLDESGRASPSPTKTASGYGRFADSPAPEQPIVRQNQLEYPPRTTSRQLPPSQTVEPNQRLMTQQSLDIGSNPPQSKARLNHPIPAQPSLGTGLPRHSAPPSDRPFSRPSAPPKPQTKPQNLRTGDRAPQSPAKPPSLVAKKPVPQRSQQQQSLPPHPPKTDGADEAWETNFSKRYPDLAGLEMVETELDGGGVISSARRPQRETRVRDV